MIDDLGEVLLLLGARSRILRVAVKGCLGGSDQGMGVKREAFVGRSRQIYFVLFEAPEVAAFRGHVGRVVAERGGTGAFRATPFDLVLTVGGSAGGFDSWFPMRVDRATDCQAPVL